MKYLIPLIFFALPAFAEQSTLQKCEALVNSYVTLDIKIAQAGLALNIQKGIVELCQKLIEAEKPKEEPKPEEPAK